MTTRLQECYIHLLFFKKHSLLLIILYHNTYWFIISYTTKYVLIEQGLRIQCLKKSKSFIYTSQIKSECMTITQMYTYLISIVKIVSKIKIKWSLRRTELKFKVIFMFIHLCLYTKYINNRCSERNTSKYKSEPKFCIQANFF